jgi:hypothetical protein
MINPDEVPADVARPESVARLLSRWLAPDEYEIWRASTSMRCCCVPGARGASSSWATRRI